MPVNATDEVRSAMRRVVAAQTALWSALAELESVLELEVVDNDWCQQLAANFGDACAVPDSALDEVLETASEWTA